MFFIQIDLHNQKKHLYLHSQPENGSNLLEK
ncbi:MAG: hypothetical protein RL311_930, partial [Bacteroidota bacterium]